MSAKKLQEVDLFWIISSVSGTKLIRDEEWDRLIKFNEYIGLQEKNK